MRLLEKEIKRWNSVWTQIERRDIGKKSFVVYHQKGIAGSLNAGANCFCAMQVMVRPMSVINNVVTPEREGLPTESEWGIYGFTYTNEASALAKMESMAVQANTTQ